MSKPIIQLEGPYTRKTTLRAAVGWVLVSILASVGFVGCVFRGLI